MDIERVRRLRDAYERALDSAEAGRRRYHDAVRELHASGMPLREIAERLGISHQRVHQIVQSAAPRRRRVRTAGAAGAIVALLAAVGVAVAAQTRGPAAFPGAVFCGLLTRNGGPEIFGVVEVRDLPREPSELREALRPFLPRPGRPAPGFAQALERPVALLAAGEERPLPGDPCPVSREEAPLRTQRLAEQLWR